MLYDVNVNRGTFTVSRSEYLKQIHERWERKFSKEYHALPWGPFGRAASK